MAMTPMDIYNKEFSKNFRGYDEEEVDMFLDQVVDEYEKLQQANTVANEKINNLTERLEHYRTLEETLKETLMTAQNTAEEVIENARKKASMIIDNAKKQAREIVEQASSEIEHLQGMDLEVRKTTAVFKSRFIALLEAQLEFFRQETASISAEKPVEKSAAQAPPPAEKAKAPAKPRDMQFDTDQPEKAPVKASPQEETLIEPSVLESFDEKKNGKKENDIAGDADTLIREIEHYSALPNDIDTVSEEGFVIGSDE